MRMDGINYGVKMLYVCEECGKVKIVKIEAD
jgi:hypothetical protein